jgi:hypothetical protein
MPSTAGVYNVRTPGAATVASGQATAPTAAQVVADTGALAAGVYDLEITLGFSGVLAAGKHLSVEHQHRPTWAGSSRHRWVSLPDQGGRRTERTCPCGSWSCGWCSLRGCSCHDQGNSSSSVAIWQRERFS